MSASVFPIALRLDSLPVLVIGGDDEALDKIPKLLRAGARVSVVCPHARPELCVMAMKRELVWYARSFVDSDVIGAHMVLLAEVDRALGERLRELRVRHRFLFGAVDQPDISDFFLVSMLTRGPVTLSVTTGGQAPLLARMLRGALEQGLGEEFAHFARNFAALRATLRDLPKPQRKAQLLAALNGFAMDVHVRYPALSGVGPTRPGSRDV